MNQKELELKFFTQITSALQTLFDRDSDHAIDIEEMNENPELFFYVLAAAAPAYLYNRITKENKDVLEINHIVNHLIFQFSKQSETEVREV